MNFGERVTTLRKHKKMTQQELADKLYVTDKTISSWEANRTEPNLEMIVLLSEVLECTTSYLLYGKKAKEPIEMEIKIRLTKDEYCELERKLNKVGDFLLESFQQDSYYQPIDWNYDMNQSLRIRTSGHKKQFTYKKNNHEMYSEEYEVEIDHSENLEIILNLIGIKKTGEVKKERKIYSYLERYEVSLDKVEHLGYFIEIEVSGKVNDYEKEYDDLLRADRKLGLNLNHIEQKRYPQLMVDNQVRGNE